MWISWRLHSEVGCQAIHRPTPLGDFNIAGIIIILDRCFTCTSALAWNGGNQGEGITYPLDTRYSCHRSITPTAKPNATAKMYTSMKHVPGVKCSHLYTMKLFPAR